MPHKWENLALAVRNDKTPRNTTDEFKAKKISAVFNNLNKETVEKTSWIFRSYLEVEFETKSIPLNKFYIE